MAVGTKYIFLRPPKWDQDRRGIKYLQSKPLSSLVLVGKKRKLLLVGSLVTSSHSLHQVTMRGVHIALIPYAMFDTFANLVFEDRHWYDIG